MKKIGDEKKTRKSIEENTFTDMVKRLSWGFNLNYKFLCTDENSDKNKKEL